MAKEDGGGAAFPNPGTYYVKDNKPCTINESASGMTLRDYFAAKAISGIATAHWSADQAVSVIADFEPDKWAISAYAIADAMLKERANP